jgi:hypothetical protein
VRYVHLPGASVDTQLLEDATRRGKLFFYIWDSHARFGELTCGVFIEAAAQQAKAK